MLTRATIIILLMLVIELITDDIRVLAVIPFFMSALLSIWLTRHSFKYRFSNFILVTILLISLYSLLFQLNMGVMIASFGVVILAEKAATAFTHNSILVLVLINLGFINTFGLLSFITGERVELLTILTMFVSGSLISLLTYSLFSSRKPDFKPLSI